MKRLFFFAAPIFFLASCFHESRKRKDPPVPNENHLLTGCYYITDDSSGVKRNLINSTDIYFLNPSPIFHVGNFREAKFISDEQTCMNINLFPESSKAFAEATGNHIGQQFAFVIDDTLIMVPKVMSKIENGQITIAGNFSRKEIMYYVEKIDKEMYE